MPGNSLVHRGTKPAQLDKVKVLTDANKAAAMALRDDTFLEEEPDGLLSARVSFVCELMEGGHWRGNRTMRDLVHIWGVSPHTVDKIAGESRRRFQSYIKDPEEFRGMLVGQLENIVGDAMNAKQYVRVKVGKDEETLEEVSAPDRKSAIAGITEIANLLGLKNKKEVKVKHELAELDLDELLKMAHEDLKEKSIDTTGTESGILTGGTFAGTDDDVGIEPSDDDIDF